MADMFANARAYEARMGRWSARLAPLFAHFANITDGGRVLDVGCGTGALVRTVAAMTRQSAIVGIDPAEPFLAYGLCRRKREIFYGRAAPALSWAKGFSLTDAHNELIRE